MHMMEVCREVCSLLHHINGDAVHPERERAAGPWLTHPRTSPRSALSAPLSSSSTLLMPRHSRVKPTVATTVADTVLRCAFLRSWETGRDTALGPSSSRERRI